MPLVQPHRTIGRIDPRSRKTLLLVVALVLAIVSLFVAGREVQAKEQPVEQTPQQRVSSVVIINGEVFGSNGAKAPRDETPPVEDPSPSPVGPVPSNPEPAPVPAPVPDPVSPAPVPAPQQFAVIIVNGEVVEYEPATPWPVPYPDTVVPEPSPDPVPVPGDAWPAPQPAPSDQYAPQTPGWDPELVPPPPSEDVGAASEPTPWPVPVTENPLPPVSSDPVPATNSDAAPSSWPTLIPEPFAPQGNGSASFPATEEAPRVFEKAPFAAPLEPQLASSPFSGKDMVPAAPAKNAPASYVAPITPIAPVPPPGRKPSAPPPLPAMSSVPVSTQRAAPRPATPSLLGATMNKAVSSVADNVQSAAAIAASAAASAAADVLETLTTSASPDDTPQSPAPPMAPPLGGSSFSLLSGGGGGQLGSAGGVAPLLVGVLASILVLLRHDCWRYLVSCDPPKPSSVLLLPLERPG